MFKMSYKKRVILLSFILGSVVDQPTPEVIIKQGTLRGRISANGDFFEFTGIPYATASENNRFQEPLPPPNWTGTFNAVDEITWCPQLLLHLHYVGHEDCLKINVYAPKNVDSTAPLPVMVFIHGGGFASGGSHSLIHGAEFFVNKGIIFVNFTYRLGIFGFLCLGTKEAPGNAGLKDQLAALHWVKNNIRAFGGDPDNVTIFGESAGAASVSYLMLTPRSKGLFKRAIMQSGSSLCPWALQTSPIESVTKLSKALGHDTSNTAEILEALKQEPIRKIVEVTDKSAGNSIVDKFVFTPCVEKAIEGVEPFITDTPYNILRSGKYHKVPTISGFTDKDGLFFSGMDTQTPVVFEEMERMGLTPNKWIFNSEEEKKHIIDEIRKFYFANESINLENNRTLGELYSDLYFKMPTIFQNIIMSRTSDQPQFHYIFKYDGSRNVMKYISNVKYEKGAVHADDLFYMFKMSVYPFRIVKEDEVVIDQITTMWTNFAKYGNPTPELTKLLPVKWTPSDGKKSYVLSIDNNLSMEPLNMQNIIEFWMKMYARIGIDLNSIS